MKYVFLFACLFFFCLTALGQVPIDPAKLISVPKAAYPELAKDTGVSGTVDVRVIVNEHGEVTEAGFIRGPGAVCRSVNLPEIVALREAALEAARQAKFSPAISNGQPVMSVTNITIGFPEPSADSRKMVAAGPVGTRTNPDGSATPGVLNGRALSLPKPAYPPAARAVRAAGPVEVEVLISEDGTMYSARAVSGHPLLQIAAAAAACSARFSPTLIDGKPTKVVGIIAYNFVP